MTGELEKRGETAIEKVNGAPAWLAEAAENDTSKDALKEHLVLPQLRIVPTSPGERMKQYKEQYGEGALVITPAGIAIAPNNTWVKVVPLFMFTEFRQWHDRDDSGSNAIVERSHDPTSLLAIKARDEARREEIYGDPNRTVGGKPAPFMYQFMEHLCFVVLVYDGEGRGTPAVLEFQRGSLWKGKEFSSACLMRRVNGIECPLWTQVWEVSTREVTKKGYTWWALEFRNPEDGTMLITDDEATSFRSQWETHREAHNAQRLVVDLADAEGGETAAATVDVVDDGEM
tara:strand:- start:15000 stop:15860 length:861 start_codon:yes stop_codon:yes gene_type:complete